jgi:hypothetical protein
MSERSKKTNGKVVRLPKDRPEIEGYQPTAYTTDGPTGQPKRRGIPNYKKAKPPNLASGIQPPDGPKHETK